MIPSYSRLPSPPSVPSSTPICKQQQQQQKSGEQKEREAGSALDATVNKIQELLEK